MPPPTVRRRSLFLAAAVAVACAVTPVCAQETPPPDTPPGPVAAAGRGRFAALSNELALYSPFESPWADVRANHAFESRLFGLMRAEVRLWDLQDALAKQQDNSAREDAAEIARIIHEQVLAGAAEALPLLQKTPNKAFAQLLVHQLEAYPYEWQEEGSEELLPSLRKLVNPPAGNTPTQGVRRHRRRPNNPAPQAVPVAPAVPRSSPQAGQ